MQNRFQWTKIEQKSLEQLKNRPSPSPTLRCADLFLPYHLSTDASEAGVGAILTPTDETGSGPVAFCSRKLNNAEQAYLTHEKEQLAIAYALRPWKSYLHESKCKTCIDRHLLKYLDFTKTLSQKQARWVEFV